MQINKKDHGQQKLKVLLTSLSFIVLTACSSTKPSSTSPSKVTPENASISSSTQTISSEQSQRINQPNSTHKVDHVSAPSSEAAGPYQQQNLGPSVVSYQAVEDPLRFINEPIFKFNDVIYEYALSPFSRGYQAVMPKPIDNSIGNFFYNIMEPVSALNYLLQGRVTKSGKNLGRVVINSTIGLFGLFDPAEHWFDISREKTSFNKTLMRYGVNQGNYVVLPFMGPTDFRGLATLPLNYVSNPLNLIHDDKAADQLKIIQVIHTQIPLLARYPQMLAEVDNRYEFIRNLYMQRAKRDQQVERNEGNPHQDNKQNKAPLIKK